MKDYFFLFVDNNNRNIICENIPEKNFPQKLKF